jgi:hypothetical protein
MVLGLDGGPFEAIHNMLGRRKIRIPYTKADDVNAVGLNLLL